MLQNHESTIRRIIRRIVLFIAVSFFAFAGTMPIVMSIFNQISLISIPANLIAVPIIGSMAVPIGLLAVFLWPLNHFISTLCIKICGALLYAGAEIIQVASNLPFAAIHTITPSGFEITCFYLLSWGLLNLGAKADLKGNPSPNHRAGTARMVSLAACILLLLDAGYWFHYRYLRKDLRVTMLDMGQGNAALLELPKGYCMLIDGGGFAGNAVFDVGRRIVAPFLWRKKISTVETLVLSHPNSDHMNGLIYIAGNFNVKNVWSNHEPSNTRSYSEFVQAIRKKGIAHPLFSTIPRRQTIHGVQFSILHPEKDFLPKKGNVSNLDDHSLVVRASFGSASFLFPGDIMAEGERELASKYGSELNSTILLAPHHGSRTSNTEEFLKAVSPETVVVSAGWKNRFNLPNTDVLNRYESLGIRIYQTGLHGAVSIDTDRYSTCITTGR